MKTSKTLTIQEIKYAINTLKAASILQSKNNQENLSIQLNGLWSTVHDSNPEMIDDFLAYNDVEQLK